MAKRADTSPAAELRGRRILITGAASGIGAATARLFAAMGAKLALLDRDEARLRASGKSLDAFTWVLDLADEKAICEAMAAAAGALGGLDGIVNAAGIGGFGRLQAQMLADWSRVIAVNLTAPFLVCREALRHLLERPGTATIVNVASGQGLMPAAPGMSSYIASKGGLIAFSKALAVELAPAIRVNVLCPGLVDTPLVPAEMKAAAAGESSPYPLKRIASAEEIAESILFLSSDRSSFITGLALAVDGGRTLH